ncbi:hypothetical protein [Bifidobacterium jacchi]|uniref:Uncharacterized protein n=1 Tax=Bifidobacterium jacchi TaxID=2490545 RepID=A0A5N5RL66_9BIFI|nr:hypothetical protein [Bifidobacterium jacchi]KAB5608075.1 hypothetical protein EHS19_02870 [Bifidobacterium jacchi]
MSDELSSKQLPTDESADLASADTPNSADTTDHGDEASRDESVEGIASHANEGDVEKRRRKDIAQRLADFRMSMDAADIEINEDDAVVVPFADLTALGVAFSSLPDSIRTMTETVTMPGNVFSVTDVHGNPLTAAMLQRFNDGTGYIGSFRDAAKNFGQARLHPLSGSTTTATGVMPYDPTTLFMAFAIMQINHKLDAIEAMQRKMFDYLKQKDKAELRGDAETLADILNGYRFNWDNDMWIGNSHMKVLDIKQEMAKACIHLRAQITGMLREGRFFEMRSAVGKRSAGIAELMREYRLAAYNHAFASFLEPMLSMNFEEEYLTSLAEDVANRDLQYRRFYTDCYDAIERRSNRTVGAAVLGGVSFLGRKLGEAVAAVPVVGDHTPIDETLIGAGDGVGRFNSRRTDDLLASLRDVSATHVALFRDGLERLNRLHNTPMVLACDEDSVYLLPQK